MSRSGIDALTVHESPHDTFQAKNHKNWLLNKAGLGVYAHGRVHQEVDMIYVGDLIHKRGHRSTDDVLLMEEQALNSMGEPLSVPSRLGSLKAMAILPSMNTANGEGDLIAYYEHGVVAFNTHEAPRESRFGASGKLLQRGWDMQRLVNHLLNTVGAVGRYAVAILTRDHFFRSTYGLHFLKVILGEGTFNSENTNKVSQDIDPLLEKDKWLEKAATGFWIGGNRMLATTGLTEKGAKGFVVWNQATAYTNDRTPIPAWEGLWLTDNMLIHKFVDVGVYGFLASNSDRKIYLATIQKKLESDKRDEQEISIRWQITTGQFAPLGLEKRGAISDAILECVVSSASQAIEVFIRTDLQPDWGKWTRVKTCQKEGRLRLMQSLGKPSPKYRECTWFQVKIEGVGFMSDMEFSLDFSPTISKMGRNKCSVLEEADEDYFDLYLQ